MLETLQDEKGTNCSWTTCLLFYNDYPLRDDLMNGSDLSGHHKNLATKITQWHGSPDLKKKLWTDSELKDQIIAHKDQHHSALALCSPIPGCCCALQVYNQIIRPRILLVCANLDNFTMVSAHQWFWRFSRLWILTCNSEPNNHVKLQCRCPVVVLAPSARVPAPLLFYKQQKNTWSEQRPENPNHDAAK